MTDLTPLDTAHAAMEAAPADDAARLRFYERLADSEMFLLLSEEVPDSHITVASRCVRVDLPPLTDEVVSEALKADGVPSDRATELAEAAAGSLSRAQLLAQDPAFYGRRNAWRTVPSRLDGTGAAVAVVVEEMRALIDEAQAPLVTRHAVELEELTEREEAFGTRGSGRRTLVERQRREVRRFRDDELRFGLATISRSYRDRAAGSGGEAAMDATARITEATGELIRNPNESLLLQALFLDLPVEGRNGA